MRSSVDSFAANVGSTLSVQLTQSQTFNMQDIDLTGPSFQGLSDPVTFRIYLYDGNSSTIRIIAIDNVVLNGSVVPEPSSALLLGVSALILLTRRRR